MKKIPALIFTAILAVAILPGSALAATLSLSPSTGTFNKGCTFNLSVVVDTGGAQTDGTDAILAFDTSKLTANTITSGTIYPDFPGNNIDPSGKITISGLASVTSAFTGQGTLATINFTVKSEVPTGATQINFDFDPNNKAKTTDSNVVQRGTVADILSSVVNGNYTIGTGSCGSSAGGNTVTTLPNTGSQGAVSTPSAEIPVKEIPQKQLPPAGTEQLTSAIVIVGSVLTVLGILGLALL